MDIQKFISTYNGKRNIPKTNGELAGQCVSLINRYCWEVLAVPAGAWGNAKDWATNQIQNQYFDKVGGAPQLGDILVWGANYGGGYGHVAISIGNGQVFDQNGGAGVATCGISQEYAGRIAILRRKGGAPELIQRKKVLADVLNIRTAPNLSAPLAKDQKAGIPTGQVKKGDVLIVKKILKGEDYGAGNDWYLTRSGYYVAAAYLGDL